MVTLGAPMRTFTAQYRTLAACLVATGLALGAAGCSGAADDAVHDITAVTDAHEATESSSPLATSGAENSTPATAGLPDPCATLTAAQISSTVGVEFAAGEPNAALSDRTQSLCEWHSSDGVAAFVQVYITADAGIAPSQRESAGMLGDTFDATVPGAAVAYSVAGGTIIGMGVGDYFVQVANVSSSMDDVTAQTVELATIVAGNL